MLEIVVPSESLEPVQAAELCLRLVEAEGIDSSRLRLYDEMLDPGLLRKALRGRKSFLIEGEGVVLRLGTAGNHNLSFFLIEGFSKVTVWTWIASITSTTVLITARVYDGEYEHWQNAEDPLEYEAVGRSMEGLPVTSNGLPPPLDQMIVDTSCNPGRRRLRDGFVEAIGHQMWLGPEYFRRVPGADREAIRSASWLKVTERPGGILELLAQEEPFVDRRTADLQVRLRRLLFAKSS